MANALLTELRIGGLSGHDGERVFPFFVANPRTVRLSSLNALVFWNRSSRNADRSDKEGSNEPATRFACLLKRGRIKSRIESYRYEELTMRTTRQLSITLPNDMADALREKVSAGEYASESEVIREGLRALFARERAVEAWLQTEVAAAYDATVADPTRTISPSAIRARLAAEQSRPV